MAPLVGKDVTERMFLPRFAEMCTDPLFHVRKVSYDGLIVTQCIIWYKSLVTPGMCS